MHTQEARPGSSALGSQTAPKPHSIPRHAAGGAEDATGWVGARPLPPPGPRSSCTVQRPHTCQILHGRSHMRMRAHPCSCWRLQEPRVRPSQPGPHALHLSTTPPPPQSLLYPRPPQPRNCGRGIASAPDPLPTPRTDRQPPGRLYHRESASPPQNRSPSSDCDLPLRTPARPAPSLGAAPVSPPHLAPATSPGTSSSAFHGPA